MILELVSKNNNNKKNKDDIPNSQALMTAANRGRRGTIMLQPEANLHILLNCRSCRVKGQHNTLEGKR